MKEKLASIGSVLSSFLAAVCWLGPLILIPLGLGGFSSLLAASLGQYRGLFIVLTVILLGTSHYLMGKQQNKSKSSKIILWVSTAISVSIILYTIIQG